MQHTERLLNGFHDLDVIDMETNKIRKAWNEAYKPLVADMRDTLTLEEICCMFFELGWNAALERNSTIHWQTGEPKEAGYYIVTTHEYTVRVAVYSPFFKGWYINRVSVEGIIAWCKLSDIKPYNNE